MKVKTYTISLLLVSLLLVSISVGGQNVEWAKRAGGGAFDYGHATCVDPDGNLYVTGEFEITGYFDGKPLVSAGVHDVFVAKYTPSGILLWAKRAGGTGGDVGYGIGLDAAGNVYVTGEIEGEADFDNVTVKAHSVVNEIFIAKYSSSGVLQWAKNAGGTNTDKGYGISVDSAGNSYLTGWFKSWAYFGNRTLVSKGEKDIFVAKYNTDGDFQWVQQAGDTLDEEGRGISVDNFGNVYATGFFTGRANFGPTTLISSGSRDIFIAKYDAAGNFRWAKNAGGSSSDAGRAVITDSFGKVYVTGEFRSKSSFGSIEIRSSGSSDAFVACYDSLGNVIWATSAGGDGSDGGLGVSTDKFSNIYLSGDFSDAATFGNTTLTCTDSAGTTDAFIAALDKNGQFLWVKQGKGENEASGNGISADNNGNVYTTGFFYNTLNFDGSYLNNTSDHKDIFLIKYSEAVRDEPTVPSSNLALTVKNCNKIQATWLRGNGMNRLVVVKAGSPVDRYPEDSKGYFASHVWGGGSDLGNGNYVVYDGQEEDSLTVIDLPPGQTYHFAVFEYNGSGFSANYYTGSYSMNNATTDSFSITASATKNAILPGESVNLSASGASTYSWTPIEGLSDPNIPNPVASPVSTTTYTVKGTSNNCFSKVAVKINVLYTGIEETTTINDIDIFPNPGKGLFTLQFKSQKSGLLNLGIINMTGATVYEEQMKIQASDYSRLMDLKHLSNGIYTLKIEINGDEAVLQKIIIQK